MPTILDFSTAPVKNYLMNGGMDTWDYDAGTHQMGTTPVPMGASRWFVRYDSNGVGGLNTPAVGRRQQASPNNKTTYCYEMDMRRNANGAGALLFFHKIESIHLTDLAEKFSISVQAKLPIGGTINCTISTANTKDSFGALTQIYTQNITVTASGSFQLFKWENIARPANYSNGIQIMISYQSATAVSLDSIPTSFQFTQFMMNNGQFALPYERMGFHLETEQMLIRRYVQQAMGLTGVGVNTSQAVFHCNFSVEMRAAPAAKPNTINGSPAAFVQITDSVSTDYNQSSFNASNINLSTQGGRFALNNFSGLTAFRPYFLENDQPAGRLIFESEL